MDNPYKNYYYEEHEEIDESFYQLTLQDLIEEEKKKEYMEFWENDFNK